MSSENKKEATAVRRDDDVPMTGVRAAPLPQAASLSSTQELLDPETKQSVYLLLKQDPEVMVAEETISTGDEETSILAPPPKRRRVVPPLGDTIMPLSNDDLEAGQELLNPEMEQFLLTFVEQCQHPKAMAAAVMRKVDLLDTAKSQRVLQTIQQISAVFEHRATKNQERKQKQKETFFFGGDNGQYLPVDLFPHVLSYLDKRDVMDSASLVSYEWAKTSLSPDMPCSQSVSFSNNSHPTFFDPAIAGETFLAMVQKPRFARVKELRLAGRVIDKFTNGAFLEKVSTCLPNLEALHGFVPLQRCCCPPVPLSQSFKGRQHKSPGATECRTVCSRHGRAIGLSSCCKGGP